MTLTMTAYTVLITLLAASLVVNMVMVSMCTRFLHWANYWKSRFQDASKPIKPVMKTNVPPEIINSPYWKDDWD